MPEPARELFLVRAKTALADLGGLRVWGGTYRNVPILDGTFREPFQVNQFPWGYLEEDNGSRLVRLTHDADGWEQYLRAVFYGYIDGDDVEGPQSWARRYLMDVEATLRSVAGVSTLIDFGEEEIQASNNLAAFIVPFTVRVLDVSTVIA